MASLASARHAVEIYTFAYTQKLVILSLVLSRGPLQQGAAVAAALCALEQQNLMPANKDCSLQSVGTSGQENHADVSCACERKLNCGGRTGKLRFAVLASGYVARCREHVELQKLEPMLRLPSLHIFGQAGQVRDRQIGPHESEALADWFDGSQRVLHPFGHVVPTARPYLEQYGTFLARML